MRDEPLAEQLRGLGTSLGGAGGCQDPAGFAAPAGVELRFHVARKTRAASAEGVQPAIRLRGLQGRGGDHAVGNKDVIPAKQPFGLVLVEFHVVGVAGRWSRGTNVESRGPT